jgi:hypothetical protein
LQFFNREQKANSARNTIVGRGWSGYLDVFSHIPGIHLLEFQPDRMQRRTAKKDEGDLSGTAKNASTDKMRKSLAGLGSVQMVLLGVSLIANVLLL